MEDQKKYKELLEKDRIYKFLLALEVTKHEKILPNQTCDTQPVKVTPKPAEKLLNQTSNI